MSQNPFAALLDSDSDSDVEISHINTKSQKPSGIVHKPSGIVHKTRVIKEESIVAKPQTKSYHPRPRVGTIPLREKRGEKGFKPRIKKLHSTQDYFKEASNTLVFETMIENAKIRSKKLSQKERKRLERLERKKKIEAIKTTDPEVIVNLETTSFKVIPEATY